jgi:hypothetical protein
METVRATVLDVTLTVLRRPVTTSRRSSEDVDLLGRFEFGTVDLVQVWWWDQAPVDPRAVAQLRAHHGRRLRRRAPLDLVWMLRTGVAVNEAVARVQRPTMPLRPCGRPGRLPHRLRPPAGHLSPGAGQQGLARPRPHLVAHRGTADRGPVHQEPVSTLSGPQPVHPLPGRRPERGLSPARTPRPATPRPRRATNARLACPVCGPFRSGRHRQRVRSRTRHASLPLSGTAEGPSAACLHRDRREHRTPQRPTTIRRNNLIPATDRLPGFPGSAQDPTTQVLAGRQQLTRREQDHRQSQAQSLFLPGERVGGW